MRKYVVLIAALLFLFSAAHATVWYVHPDSALNSVQAGIDCCLVGDTVLVGAGTYIENINFNGKAITVKSEYGPDTTIIDGSNPPHPDTGSVVILVNEEETNSVLEGFTITNGSGTTIHGDNVGGGIVCWDSSPTIIGNIITGNTANCFCGGIYCGGGAVVIADNIVSGNTATWGIGIYCGCYEGHEATIINNTITENTGYGILCDGDGRHNISDNTITVNTGGGIEVCCCGNACIIGNTITDNAGCGIYQSASWSTITNNIITGNTGGGIACDGYDATITNNTITGNTATYGGGLSFGCPGGGCSATVTNNIITANTATCGGGIYQGGCYCGVYVDIFDNTITDNTATQRGGGICFETDYPYNEIRIIANTIADNTASYGGGVGIWTPIHCADNFREIIDNKITNNTASRGGGIGVSGSIFGAPPTMIINNTITSNTAQYGSGVLCSQFSLPDIKYCTISANSGDGVYSESGSVPVINYNNITDNTGYGVRNVDPNVLLDGCYNWWGNSSGPGGVGPGTGDEVSEWVNYAYWFARPVILRDTLDFKPNTFNKKRHGKFVTVYLELRDPYDPAEIDLSEISLCGDLFGYVVAEPKPTCVGDYDNDSFPDRMIKFNADLVNNILSVGDSVKVSLQYDTGDWYWSWVWKRMLIDYIRVIEPAGPQSAGSAEIQELKLASIYPNPFTGSTAIKFSNSHDTHVALKIYDISGRLVKSLVNGKVDAGKHTINWNACDDAGRNLPSGVYFLKFEAGDYSATEKLLLIR